MTPGQEREQTKRRFQRPVTHAMARAAYFKMHHALYNHEKTPALTIPPSENDVDVLLADYFTQQEINEMAAQKKRGLPQTGYGEPSAAPEEPTK